MAEFQQPLEAMPDAAVVGDVPFIIPVVPPGRLGRDLPDLVAGLLEQSIDVPFLECDPLAKLLVDFGKASRQGPDKVGQFALRLCAEVLLDLVVPVCRSAFGRPNSRGSASSSLYPLLEIQILPQILLRHNSSRFRGNRSEPDRRSHRPLLRVAQVAFGHHPLPTRSPHPPARAVNRSRETSAFEISDCPWSVCHQHCVESTRLREGDQQQPGHQREARPGTHRRLAKNPPNFKPGFSPREKSPACEVLALTLARRAHLAEPERPELGWALTTTIMHPVTAVPDTFPKGYALKIIWRDQVTPLDVHRIV